MNDREHALATGRRQWWAYGLLSLVVGCLAVASTTTRPESYRPYVGGVPPLLVVGVVVALGGVGWAVVLPRGWFEVYRPGAVRRSLPVVVGLPILLAGGMIVVDVLAVLPPDLNVRFPASLTFYPTIGFVVAVVFHLLPLASLLLAASTRLADVDRPGVFWGTLVAVASLEPTFQVGLGTGTIPLWASAYVGANVFAVDLAQLYLLRRDDFLASYAFRLVYSLRWHVGWGHVRLQLLF